MFGSSDSLEGIISTFTRTMDKLDKLDKLEALVNRNTRTITENNSKIDALRSATANKQAESLQAVRIGINLKGLLGDDKSI